MTTGAEWVERLASSLGIPPPTPEETDALLAVAGVAAHASERTAAPLTTWLAGRAGITPDEARAVADRMAADFEAEEASRAGRPS